MNVSIQEAVKCPKCGKLNIVEIECRDCLRFGDIEVEDRSLLTYPVIPEMKAEFCQECDAIFVVQSELSLSTTCYAVAPVEADDE